MDWQCIHTHCKHLVVKGFTSEGSNLGKMPEEEHLFEETDSSRKQQISPLRLEVGKTYQKHVNIQGPRLHLT